MISWRRALLLASLAIIAMPAGTATAVRPAPRVCLPVRATGVGHDLGGGMTEATISSHGVVIGHTRASFVPVAGTPGAFTGPIVLTTSIGRLTAQVAGTFAATGEFSATSSSVTGTGFLSGVTGSLRFNGQEDLTKLSFTEMITGRLCLGGRAGVAAGSALGR